MKLNEILERFTPIQDFIITGTGQARMMKNFQQAMIDRVLEIAEDLKTQKPFYYRLTEIQHIELEAENKKLENFQARIRAEMEEK